MKRLLTVPEASHKPIRAYTDDDGYGVVYVIDTSDRFGAIRGLDGKWEAGYLRDVLVNDYHLILDYDEVVRLATAARAAIIS